MERPDVSPTSEAGSEASVDATPDGGQGAADGGLDGDSSHVDATVPLSLCDRASCKLVFVTHDAVPPSTTGPAGFDAICAAAAVATGATDLQGRLFRAWVSDLSGSASSRMTPSNLPYRRFDGIQVALNFTSLTSSNLDSPMSVTERGANLGGEHVWTGTQRPGTVTQQHCNQWTSVSKNYLGDTGLANRKDSEWTYVPGGELGCDQRAHVYCIEQ